MFNDVLHEVFFDSILILCRSLPKYSVRPCDGFSTLFTKRCSTKYEKNAFFGNHIPQAVHPGGASNHWLNLLSVFTWIRCRSSLWNVAHPTWVSWTVILCTQASVNLCCYLHVGNYIINAWKFFFKMCYWRRIAEDQLGRSCERWSVT